MSKRFQINIIDSNLATAWKQAELLLREGSLMMHELRFKNDWKYNSGTGERVYEELLRNTLPLRVFIYWPRNRFTSAIGTYNPKTGNLHINGYKLPKLTVPQLVAHLCHEYAHHQGFTHGNNWYTKNKGLYSVPYYISDNMNRWLGVAPAPKKKLVCKRTWKTLWLKETCYETN